MENSAKTYSIGRIEGDVLVHHGAFGWVRAREGMGFPETTRITIKTGKDATAEIVNTDGRRFEVPPRSLRLIDGRFTEDDIQKLRFIKVSARDMKAARSLERLAPAL
jgi:hypothetical protein